MYVYLHADPKEKKKGEAKGRSNTTSIKYAS